MTWEANERRAVFPCDSCRRRRVGWPATWDALLSPYEGKVTMRKILIPLAIAVVGAAASTGFAQPTLDSTPDRVWRDAPESFSVEARPGTVSGKRPEAATSRRQGMPATEPEQPTR